VFIRIRAVIVGSVQCVHYLEFLCNYTTVLMKHYIICPCHVIIRKIIMHACLLVTIRGMSHGTQWYGGQAKISSLVMCDEIGKLLHSVTFFARH
jgi:hypothetical protein